MREIARFLGITTYFCTDLKSSAHFHVVYNQHNGVIDADRLAVNGNLPPRIAAIALEWAMANQQMLKDNWEILKNGGANLIQIPPLVE